MRIFFGFVNSLSRWALPAVVASAMLTGCGGPVQTPEAAGQRVGQFLCEQYNQKLRLVAARDAQLLAELEAGTIKNGLQFHARIIELSKPLDRYENPNLTIRTTDSLAASLDAAFPEPMARQQAGRVVGQYVDRCDSARKTTPQRDLSARLHQLRAQLPGPDYVPAAGEAPPAPPASPGK